MTDNMSADRWIGYIFTEHSSLCWYQCSLYIIRDSARRIRIIYNTCIDTNRVESLRHPRSPLNGEIYPRHICKEDSSDRYIINDGRLRAGHARVATRQGVEWRKTTKNTLQYFEDEADCRLYVGINAVVYN